MKYILSILFITSLQLQSNAQGCVAVRQMGGVNAMYFSNSYLLSKGDIQVGANYRYFHSWRHFVGTEEQHHRQNTGGGIGLDGIDRGNAVNIYSNALDLNFSYGLSNRVQLNATIPYVHNERSQILRQKQPVVDTFRYSVFASGLADIRLSFNYMVFNPNKAHNGNLLVGAGVKLNTGSYSETDLAPQANGTKRIGMMDQAIQPGDGGIGLTVEIQGYHKVFKNTYGFINGYYLFNPKESNGSFKSQAEAGLEGYNLYACPDQYFLRAGLLAVVGKAQKLSFSLAGRWEGIPAYDAFGGQVAYRRPGYVIAIEPGVSYSSGQHSFSLFVPYNIAKNRVQSAADIAKQNMQNTNLPEGAEQVHVQGDAAFADYSITLGYSYRFVKMKKHTEKNMEGAHK